MSMFTLGVAAAYVVLGVAYAVADEIGDAANIFLPIFWLIEVLLTPPYVLYKMVLRGLIKGGTAEYFDKVNAMHGNNIRYKSIGKIRFCHDPTAHAFVNRWFIARVK